MNNLRGSCMSNYTLDEEYAYLYLYTVTICCYLIYIFNNKSI